MSLSICLITADPAARVAAILEPLRPLATEVIIAADARVPPETLAGYCSFADRVFSIDYVMSERHLAWLCAQCSGDWVLRLDGDEVPSRGLLARLPELLAERHVQQYWIRRAWLFGETPRELASPPWSEDFVNRLSRNDGTLRVPGVQHTHFAPLAPCEYIEEPLYHLDLLTSSHAQRRDKTVLYETTRPGLLTAGGARLNETFYLPELSASLELKQLPAGDRAVVAQALVGSVTPTPEAVKQVPFVSLAEMDRTWEGRAVGPDAYGASVELREPTVWLAPSERRHILFHVRNEGSETWPALLEARPQIRLSYRWLNTDGGVHISDGARSPFPRVVHPGETVLTPLHVEAPPQEGDYVLEVDVVHEDVRWFDCACRVLIRVGQPPGLSPSGPRLAETPSPRLRRWRRVRIPRVIHRIWLDDQSMPEVYERRDEAFVDRNRGWSLRVWREAELSSLGIDPELRSQTPQVDLLNIVCYEILYRHGGVCVNIDLACPARFAGSLRGIAAFATLNAPGRLDTDLLGAVAGHVVFRRAAVLARRTPTTSETGEPAPNGDRLLSLVVEQEGGVAILARNVLLSGA